MLVINISYFPNLHYWLPLLENLGTVKLSCLKHCQRLFVHISFSLNFMPHTNKFYTQLIFPFSRLLLLFFFFFFQFFLLFSWLIAVICFAVFILTKHFCKSSNTCGSSAHFAIIWHADKTELVTVPLEKKYLLNFDLLSFEFFSKQTSASF